MKLRNFLIIIFIVVAIGITIYFTVQSFTPNSQFVPSYNVTYGVFRIPVYGDNGKINNTLVQGVMVAVNNEGDNSLKVISVSNSSYTFKPSYIYLLQQVPLDNGSFTNAYIKVTEIYIGYNTIIIPVKLSPGIYQIQFSDGTTISFRIT
ncbi:hypothetical protein [Sulfolobus sp. E11-6]|uniref:hypothetical protein n=1 Tax=Sulfolobus sp. E11-6 TaxID=2663020 RepID=UPI001296514F|nr:hypothetical protein [Sulfolobus sp. E11-6]QGA69226.1 hypothetical protein GFS33_11420 [Sulfolobus sp. E11-6]